MSVMWRFRHWRERGRPLGDRCRAPVVRAPLAAIEQVKSLGYVQAPVVITDEDHWSGFRPDKIDELATRLA